MGTEKFKWKDQITAYEKIKKLDVKSKKKTFQRIIEPAIIHINTIKAELANYYTLATNALAAYRDYHECVVGGAQPSAKGSVRNPTLVTKLMALGKYADDFLRTRDPGVKLDETKDMIIIYTPHYKECWDKIRPCMKRILSRIQRAKKHINSRLEEEKLDKEKLAFLEVFEKCALEKLGKCSNLVTMVANTTTVIDKKQTKSAAL